MGLKLFYVFDEPVGLALDITQCKNGCVYCYSSKRVTDRHTSMRSLENIINNSNKKKSLLNYYIQNRYPVSIANNSDINNCGNFEYYRDMVKFLKSLGFPIYYETKGCHNEADIARFVELVQKDDYVYLTLTTFDDEKRKQIEPLAPSPEMRLKLLYLLRNKGIKVELAFNPAMPGFITDSEIINFISENRDINYYFFTLHLPSWSKLEIKKLKKYDFTNIAKFCKENKIRVGGDTQFFGCELSAFDKRKHFNKPMIIAHDVDDLAVKYKKENFGEEDKQNNVKNLVSFDDFYEAKKEFFIDTIVNSQSDIYFGRNSGSYIRGNLPEEMSYKDYIRLAFHNADRGLIFKYSFCARIEYPTGEIKYFDYR